MVNESGILNKEKQANAHLIAAAPEMLDRLHYAVNFMYEACPDREPNSPAQASIDYLLATIAKAEGRHEQ